MAHVPAALLHVHDGEGAEGRPVGGGIRYPDCCTKFLFFQIPPGGLGRLKRGDRVSRIQRRFHSGGDPDGHPAVPGTACKDPVDRHCSDSGGPGAAEYVMI